MRKVVGGGVIAPVLIFSRFTLALYTVYLVYTLSKAYKMCSNAFLLVNNPTVIFFLKSSLCAFKEGSRALFLKDYTFLENCSLFRGSFLLLFYGLFYL